MSIIWTQVTKLFADTIYKSSWCTLLHFLSMCVVVDFVLACGCLSQIMALLSSDGHEFLNKCQVKSVGTVSLCSSSFCFLGSDEDDHQLLCVIQRTREHLQ